MQTEDLQQLKLDLAVADPSNDWMLHDLLKRSVSLLGLSVVEIAKAMGTANTNVENWIDGYGSPTEALRPWLFKYLSKQIEAHGEVISYHATDEYGHKYIFDNADQVQLSNLAYQLSKCSNLLERVQLSYAPPQMRLSFFTDSTRNADTKEIEELHYLIAGMGGYAEARIGGNHMATVIPLGKQEKEGIKNNFAVSLRHCFELKDGCHISVGGRCTCACCLLEKKAIKPIGLKSA